MYDISYMKTRFYSESDSLLARLAFRLRRPLSVVSLSDSTGRGFHVVSAPKELNLESSQHGKHYMLNFRSLEKVIVLQKKIFLLSPVVT